MQGALSKGRWQDWRRSSIGRGRSLRCDEWKEWGLTASQRIERTMGYGIFICMSLCCRVLKRVSLGQGPSVLNLGTSRSWARKPT